MAASHDPSKQDGEIRPCKVCGYWRGTVGRPLTPAEREALLNYGFQVEKNAIGDDIARPTGVREYNDARAWYHHTGHCPRRTWHEHLLTNGVEKSP